MAGPESLKHFSPRASWIRKKLGYPALFIGSTIAKITVKGRWHLPKKGPFIVAANHFSYIDPPFFKYAIRKPINFLGASDQNIDWYFMWAPILYGFIPIDRTNLAPSTIKKAKKALKRGEILGIFPEGTSTSDSLRKEPYSSQRWKRPQLCLWRFMEPKPHGATYFAVFAPVLILILVNHLGLLKLGATKKKNQIRLHKLVKS